MLHHVRAVRRGTKDALLIADMPYGSYHATAEEAIHNAARFVKEAGAEAVKMEGGEKRVDVIRRVIDAEIPVAGHIGLTPQSVNMMGGYKVQGKTLNAIEQSCVTPLPSTAPVWPAFISKASRAKWPP